MRQLRIRDVLEQNYNLNLGFLYIVSVCVYSLFYMASEILVYNSINTLSIIANYVLSMPVT